MSTPKKIIATCLLFATLSAFSGCSAIGIGKTTIAIGEMGVSVDRPASWKKTQLQKDDKYVDYVIDIPQKKSDPSNVEGHVAINLAKPIGQEKLTIEGELKGLTKYLSNRVTDLRTVEERDVTFMGQAGKRLILEFKNAEDRSISERLGVTFTLKNNMAYAIIIDEDTKDFEELMPIYEEMAASMKFSQ